MISLSKKKSAGMRIKGIVHEYDIALTLLALTGIERPDSMSALDFSCLLGGNNR